MTPGTIRRSVFWLGSFASIATLLVQMYGLTSMYGFARWVWLPVSAAMLGIWLWGEKVQDNDFLLRVRSGFIGGLWGTIGYDLVRIPFHLAGQNPFPPIRSYGLWLAGAPFSNPWTDLLGFAYHFGNGITFGWIYSFLFLNRRVAWAVVWGLVLESFAVFTPFGVIYRLKFAYQALGLAYAAHLLYGYPLGRACRRPEWAAWRPNHTLLLLFCWAWFMTAWQPIGHQPALVPGQIEVGPDAFYPGWSDLARGSKLTLASRLPEGVTLKFRRPSTPLKKPESLRLESGQTGTLELTERGIYQIGLPDKKSWRSIFIAVHEGPNYSPEP
ncbi:MAG: hypothetical protein HYS41_02310 [Candidatus Omnitrophica bacterium]|nr:hypothetical protein [Candidatus Omnitrophota bacterium]